MRVEMRGCDSRLKFLICAVLLLGGLLPGGVVARAIPYEPKPSERGVLTLGGTRIGVLLDRETLGGEEIEVGELMLPAGTRGAVHSHSRVEVFYVLSGSLEHIVGQERFVLGPGDVGVVRPGDDVVHSTLGEEPVRALVMWAPGGALQELIDDFGFGWEQASRRAGGAECSE